MSDDEQKRELARVHRRIGDVIVDWCIDRLHAGRTEFSAGELLAHVAERGGAAPGSAVGDVG